MEILVIVNESPWGSSLPLAALRFATAALDQGNTLRAVYFQHDAVYHAIADTESDPGTPVTSESWEKLSALHGFDLLLCSSALNRRLGRAGEDAMAEEPQATRRPRLGESSEASGTRGVVRPFIAVERSRLPRQAGAGKRDSFVFQPISKIRILEMLDECDRVVTF